MSRSPLVVSRRRALREIGGVAALLATGSLLMATDSDAASECAEHEARGAASGGSTHPAPREGVTAENVLPDEGLPRKARDAYAAAREIPEVLDGIYCHCECAERRGRRSLLSCFESKMPISCGICTGEARLALKLHCKGKTLNEIRAAIDERYT